METPVASSYDRSLSGEPDSNLNLLQLLRYAVGIKLIDPPGTLETR